MARENFFDIAYSLEADADTQAMYDRWAAVYDSDLTAGEYQQPARCAAALSIINNKPDINILDVGCGTGLGGIALKRAGYQNIDGCDLSSEMLTKAKALGIYDRLFTCNLNIPPLDVPDESYHAVTAVGVFSFGHVSANAVDEFVRILKQGAHLIIGLNDHFYDEGSLVQKLETLEETGSLKILDREHGEHIPANKLKGWVISCQKT